MPNDGQWTRNRQLPTFPSEIILIFVLLPSDNSPVCPGRKNSYQVKKGRSDLPHRGDSADFSTKKENSLTFIRLPNGRVVMKESHPQNPIA